MSSRVFTLMRPALALALAYCNFYAVGLAGGTRSWVGWFCIAAGLFAHWVCSSLPSGDADDLSDAEIDQHGE